MSRFLKMYLIVGMLFGISISLFYIFLYSGSVLYGILCGIIGFVVIGLIHGLIVSTFSKITYPIAGCSLVIVIGVLGINGFILGLLSFWGMSLLPQGNWHQLKTPPEEVVEIMDNAILDFWGGRINVRTISDKKYTYDCWGEQDCVWTEFNPTQSVEGTMNEICPPDQKRKHYPTPPFPGKVVSSQIFDVCGADFTVQYNFVLLEDGIIWAWDRYWSVYETILYYPLMGLTGMIVSVVSGLAMRDKKYKGIYL